MVHLPKSPSGDLDCKWVNQIFLDSAYPMAFDQFANAQILHQSVKAKSGFQIIQNELLIDVTDTCNFNINTGIQRVVRNLVKELVQSNVPLRLVTWNSSETALRELTDKELSIATGKDISLGHDPVHGLQDPEHYLKLVPINCNFFIPELATQTNRLKRTICMVEFTSNKLFTIGYDAVPILLPDTTSMGMVTAFALQLEMLKHSTAILGISNSTAEEFDSIFSGLISQGIIPPRVVSVPLPVVAVADRPSNGLKASEIPRLLIVGSHEPRKNHENIIAAAEMLWQKNWDFELHFVGSRGWESEFFWKLVDRLQVRNRKLYCHVGISDSELAKLYLNSSALVSVSLHEGFGLPVAEAIAVGLPVITVDRGSQGELARLFSAQVSKGTGVYEIREALHLFLNEEIEFMDGSINKQVKTASLSTWEQYAKEVYELVKL
jgi:glycosyltransferase involved in cell wall biosynthesis